MTRSVVSDSVVEGYMANSKPLRQERLHCLLPTANVGEEKKKKEVGQLTIKDGKVDIIENFDSFVNLSDLPLDSEPVRFNNPLRVFTVQ